MGNLVRSHPTMVSVLILIWFTYGPYSAEIEAVKGAQKPESIDASYLETRPAGARAVTVPSPFLVGDEPPEPGRRNDVPPMGAWLVEPMDSARQAWASTHDPLGPAHLALALAWRQGLVGARALQTLARLEGLLDEVELPGGGSTPGFALTLESLLAFSGGDGRARISGRDVRVGDEIPGFDPHSPPRLLRVEGVSVLIEHRGEEAVLDLDRTPSAWFGPAPPGG